MIYFVQNQNRKEKLNLISKNCPTSLSVKKRHISGQITVGQSGFPFLQKILKNFWHNVVHQTSNREGY